MTGGRTAMAAMAGIAAILVAIIVLELRAPAPGIRVAPVAAPSATPPAADSAQQRADWVAGMLQRPLFAPDRRPPAASVHSEGAPEGAAPGPVPRLAGIVIDPGGKRALFQPQGGDRPLIVREGDEIAGWRVRAISGRQVVLSGPGGDRIVVPKPDPTLQEQNAAPDGEAGAAEAAQTPPPLAHAPARGVAPAHSKPPHRRGPLPRQRHESERGGAGMRVARAAGLRGTCTPRRA